MRDIVMLILAAGKSERMGTDKLLLPFGRGTVLSTVIDTVLSAGIPRVLLVTSTKIGLNPHGFSHRVEIVVNDSPELGQSFSLKLGIERVKKNCCPFGITQGDMPLINKADVDRLLQIFWTRPATKTAVVPECRNRFGHPVLFEPLWANRLLEAKGDEGGRSIIKNHIEEVLFVTAGSGCFIDIDNPEDYAKLRE